MAKLEPFPLTPQPALPIHLWASMEQPRPVNNKIAPPRPNCFLNISSFDMNKVDAPSAAPIIVMLKPVVYWLWNLFRHVLRCIISSERFAESFVIVKKSDSRDLACMRSPLMEYHWSWRISWLRFLLELSLYSMPTNPILWMVHGMRLFLFVNKVSCWAK